MPFSPPFRSVQQRDAETAERIPLSQARPWRDRVDGDVGFPTFTLSTRSAGGAGLYGRRGLCQHQSVYPVATAPETTARLLETARRAGHASVGTKLQRFGDIASPGLLSFARPGFTLTMDFADQGEATVKLSTLSTRLPLSRGCGQSVPGLPHDPGPFSKHHFPPGKTGGTARSGSGLGLLAAHGFGAWAKPNASAPLMFMWNSTTLE